MITNTLFSITALLALAGSVAMANPLLTVTNDLTLWLAADVGVTNSGGRVSGWADQSGAGQWAGQTSADNQPTLLTNQLNGLPVVRFGAGGDHFLYVAGQVIASQQFTIIAVTRDFDSSGSYRELISNWDWGWGGSSVFFGTTKQNPVRVRFTDNFGGAGDGQAGVGAITDPASFFILTGVSGTNSVAVYTNAAATAWRGTPLTPRTLTGLYAVGRQGTLNNEYWRGDIAELLVYNRELLAGELGHVWQYLGDKYWPGTPSLSVSRTSTNTVVVSWPSPSTGWNLQQNTNSISSVNWSNVASGIQDDGTTKMLIVNPPTGNRFYRLRQ